MFFFGSNLPYGALLYHFRLAGWQTGHMRIFTEIGSRITGALPCLLLLYGGGVGAAEQPTPHTYALAPGESPPPVTLDAAGMLVGRWEGEAFGGRFEETWNAPTADSMVGMFKLYDGDGVDFYELMLITVDDGVLTLKVRHFNRDFSAWEDKTSFVSFPLVGVEEDALHFAGLSFYRQGADELHAYLVMHKGEALREEKLVYRRIR